jgi:ATP-dependent 26S proteasome regulatory subunit
MTDTTQSIAFHLPAYGVGISREAHLEAMLKQMEARMQELQEQPLAIGIIVRIANGRATLLFGGQTLERKLPPWAKDAKPGMAVKIVAQGGHLLEFFSPPIGAGVVVTLGKIHNDVAEYTMQGIDKTAVLGAIDAKEGDRVVLDPSQTICIRNLGGGGTAKTFTGDTGVRWDDIGGLEDAKRAMRESIEEPVKHKKLYERFGRRRVKGIGLYGPPGCGKTMLAKAAATALAELHGSSAKATGFIYAKGPDLLHMLVGQSEANIRALFASAKAHHEEHGYPAIIFLDEADGLLGRRGQTRWEGMERTIVPQFLAEMDGLEDSMGLVMIATNRPDTLDPAFMRDGRIDKKITVGRPTREDSESILAKALKGRPLAGKAEELCKKAIDYLWSEGHVLFQIKCKDGNGVRFTLSRLVSGALLAGIAERATQHAIRRALDSSGDESIGAEDLKAGVDETKREQLSINHDAELAEVVEPIKDKVIAIEKGK